MGKVSGVWFIDSGGWWYAYAIIILTSLWAEWIFDSLWILIAWESDVNILFIAIIFLFGWSFTRSLTMSLLRWRYFWNVTYRLAESYFVGNMLLYDLIDRIIEFQRNVSVDFCKRISQLLLRMRASEWNIAYGSSLLSHFDAIILIPTTFSWIIRNSNWSPLLFECIRLISSEFFWRFWVCILWSVLFVASVVQ